MLLVQKYKKKQKALELRDQGKSYSEIGSMLSISKSTLSYWLHRVEMTNKQKAVLLQRQREGRIKGAQKRKSWRLAKERNILVKAAKEVSRISKRELWLLGTISYWCEGSKQKANNISGRVIFANSDPFLIKLFVKWIKEICGVSEDRLIYTLYIHETGNLELSLNFWSKIIGINKESFAKTILKKHNISTNRKYDNDLYFGLLRVTVRNSTDLNRQIKGWIEGVNGSLN